MDDTIQEPGIFEQIPIAVHPLTEDGDFRLDTIEYIKSRYDEYVQIFLRSSEIDIRFVFNPSEKGNSNPSCTFGNRACTYDFRSTGCFRARTLFLAFSIDIPMPYDDFHLPENTGSIQEIFRLSTEIKKNLPKIMDLFRPEKIEDTIARYTLEVGKPHELKIREGRRRDLARLTEKPIKQVDNQERIQEVQNTHPINSTLPLKGKLGNIKEVIRQFISRDMFITFHRSQDSVDIKLTSLYHKCESKMNIFINQEVNNTAAAYFLIYPSYPFIKERKDLIRDQKVIVFPDRNAFRLLGIPYSYEPKGKGFLSDLAELCQLIRDNLPILCEAFSEKNLEKTYTALIPMEGNNREDIQNLVRHFYAKAFATSAFQMKKRQRFLSRSYIHGDTL